MWTRVPSPPEAKIPTSRSKHASILHGQCLYLLGGRNGNVPLKDFWRYNIAKNTWDQLIGDGDSPGCLQEHTMVGYRDTLYVFGGEVGFSNGVETPLWMYNIKDNKWRKFIAPKGVVTPKGRRSHTATVFQDSMYIYGGYQDLRGSTSELWAFHFASETWHLVSQGGAVDGAPPRHRHSAILHDNAVWIFGGMTDLQERSDFWRFDFVSRRWRPVKSKPGPGCIHSHCAVKFLSVMIVFGGERDGQVLNEMWRFHFATEFWEKLSFVSNQPMPRAQTTAFIFSQFRTRGMVHYMGLPEQDYFGSKPEPAYKTTLEKTTEQAAKNNSSTSKDNEGGQKYIFAVPDSCMDDTASLSGRIEQVRDFLPSMGRKPSQFQRFDNVRNGAPANLIKDFAKMSNMNISRLSNYCSYSMFSNDSTESLNTASSTASPCSVRLAKSRSSQQLLNLTLQEPDVSPQKSLLGSLPRDPMSVPNFRSLQKSNSLDSEDGPEPVQLLAQAANALSVKESPDFEESNSGGRHLPLESMVPHHGLITDIDGDALQAPCRSDSNYTFQSYDCSSRSSTLSSQHSSANIPKSSSINRGFFSGETKLVDLEEEEAATFYSSDEFSSLSGYESIEAVNREDCESRMSFANPHYLGPDVQAIIDRKRVIRTNYLLRDDSHQSFAQALNSPADSLYSDYQDFHSRLNQDFVEMNQIPSYKTGPQHTGSSAAKPAKVISTISRNNSQFSIASKNALNEKQAALNGRRPSRPISAEIIRENKVSPLKTLSSHSAEPEGVENQLMLLMYILGGREVGQVTVFKRPISVWKLDLTKTF